MDEQSSPPPMHQPNPQHKTLMGVLAYLGILIIICEISHQTRVAAGHRRNSCLGARHDHARLADVATPPARTARRDRLFHHRHCVFHHRHCECRARKGKRTSAHWLTCQELHVLAIQIRRRCCAMRAGVSRDPTRCVLPTSKISGCDS